MSVVSLMRSELFTPDKSQTDHRSAFCGSDAASESLLYYHEDSESKADHSINSLASHTFIASSGRK